LRISARFAREQSLQRFKFGARNVARLIYWEVPACYKAIDAHPRKAATPGNFSLRYEWGYKFCVTAHSRNIISRSEQMPSRGYAN